VYVLDWTLIYLFVRTVHNMGEWVSDCLMPSGLFFSYIMTRISYISTRWWSCSLCTRPTSLVGFWYFDIASSLKHELEGRHVASLKTHYPYSEHLCSYSLMLHAQQRSSKFHFHSLLFEPTGLKPTIYCTRSENAKHHTTDAIHLKLNFVELKPKGRTI